MKVFGLRAPVYRGAALASRLTAKTSPIAAVRRDALERWRCARAHGLSADEAAHAMGVSRATLYRWQRQAEPRSRRPHRLRQPTWTSGLVRAVERLRTDHPMWGKRKLAALLRRQGIAVSVSMVGRILKRLMNRGAVTPVPILRRKPGGRRFRILGQRHARGLPKGLRPRRPGELVQIDALFVNVRPDKAIKHFTAYDPVAKWTAARVATEAADAAARAFLDQVFTAMPFRVAGVQVDGGSEFRAEFEKACQDEGLALFVLPPKRPQLNGAIERAPSTWRYEFYACHDLPHRLDKLQPLVERLRLPVQQPSTAPGPWRSHPSRIPLNPQHRRTNPVSHVLNQDISLTAVCPRAMGRPQKGG